MSRSPVFRPKSLRAGRLSWLVNPRLILTAGILIALGFLLFAVALGTGDYPLSVPDVVRILTTDNSTRIERLVVFQWRMPRAAAAAGAGAAFALSGALMQSVTRNALASPDVLGITTGSSTMAVVVIVFGSTTGLSSILSGTSISFAALIGGLATACVLWLAGLRTSSEGSFRTMRLDVFKLVLVGIVLTALLKACINFMLIRADINDAAAAKFWLAGSLDAVSWSRVRWLLIVFAACALVSVWLSFELRVTQLGPDLATSLGQNRSRVDMGIMLCSVLLAAFAVSATGPIGFIAFVSPQIAMRLAGTSTPPLLTSAACGAVLLLASDLTTQTLLPVELPVGLLTSALGGIFLIYVLIRGRRKASL